VRLNPVLDRELRERVRGPRALVVLTLYLGLLVVVFYFVYRAQASGKTGDTIAIAPTDVARIGRGIFEWVLFIMLILILVLVPGLSAGSIAGERERQTLVPMQVTGLKARSIVTGKIAASLAFLFLLILASLPLFSLSYLIGGIDMRQALGGLGAVLLTGVVLACVATACSAYARRVQTATVLAYGVVLLLTAGSFLAYSAGVLLTGRNEAGNHPPTMILVANPVVLTAAIIAPSAEQTAANEPSNSPIAPIHDRIEPIRLDSVGGVAPAGPKAGGRGTTTTTGRDFGPRGVIVAPVPTTASVASPAKQASGASGASGAVGDGAGADAPSFARFIWSSLVTMLGLIVVSVWFSAIRLRIPAENER
jgi:ABC-type transport system involved in multi-copper enzyme maturation permease subunit